MFGTNKPSLTQEQVQELIEQCVKTQLETAVSAAVEQVMKETVEPLQQRLEQLEQQVKKLNTSDTSDVLNATKGNCAFSLHDGVQQPSPFPSQSTAVKLFLAAPTVDGTWSESSVQEVLGKSIYRITTNDGQTGRFALLSTPDAVATASLSVSQMVKPACRVEGRVHQQPHHIVTIEEGSAHREGEMWVVDTKAVVRFE